jgi:D-glycero-D-manno-heptose 1,7-bisphosphate phosphatase
MKKAIFLDRDGVVITERGEYNYKTGHISFPEGIVEALQYFSSKGYLLIVVSNQSGIAKGLYHHSDAKVIHKVIKEFLGSYGIKITDFFYCPHHPSHGKCICRKPDTLLIEKALAIYQIDPSESYFIGDMDRDAEAAVNAGLTPVKINPNDNLTGYLKLFNF